MQVTILREILNAKMSLFTTQADSYKRKKKQAHQHESRTDLIKAV